MKIRIYDAGRHAENQTGYGQMANGFFHNLKGQGHNVAWYSEKEKHTDDTIYLWIRPPHYVKYDQFKPEHCNVFFTMHELETFDGWKQEWPSLLNKCAGVITPSQWNKQVFEKAGVSVPIQVCPIGLDQKTFYDRHRAFSVLAVHENLGGDSSRENWQQTAKVFLTKFYKMRDYKLTIKTWNWKPADWQSWLRKLIDENKWDTREMPQVQVYEMRMEPQTMAQLYRDHHVFIKNTKGEGWSLPAQEAFNCGCFLVLSALPMFQERFKQGTQALYFSNEQELDRALEDAHREWKKVQGQKEAYSWRNCTKRLVDCLETVYGKYQQQRAVE